MQIIGNFFIGKIGEQYFAFYLMPEMGGVTFSVNSPAFHTIEEAHQYLLDKAKEQSSDKFHIGCVEVLKEYMFIGTEIDDDEDGA